MPCSEIFVDNLGRCELNYRICSKCVMDTSDPNIEFYEDGSCNHCRSAGIKLEQSVQSLDLKARELLLEERLNEIKRIGVKSQYDCIIGLSGGVDSTYVAYLCKSFGLRPLAVHLDNGWNSELAVKNIENICKGLSIDLETVVLDWDEFKSIQLAFLRASTPDSEIPSDHAIVASLYGIAKKYGIKTIIAGYNVATESILPLEWSQGHFDWKYIKSICRLMGGGKIKSFPHFGLIPLLRFTVGLDLYRGIKLFNILDYIIFDKENAKILITEKLNWNNYGRKHGESTYTRVFQEMILPLKFGYDKRRAHFSSMIVAGQMTRSDALQSLEEPLYATQDAIDSDVDYLCAKFDISHEEFNKIMNSAPKRFGDFPSYKNSWYVRTMRCIWRFFSGKRK